MHSSIFASAVNFLRGNLMHGQSICARLSFLFKKLRGYGYKNIIKAKPNYLNLAIQLEAVVAISKPLIQICGQHRSVEDFPPHCGHVT